MRDRLNTDGGHFPDQVFRKYVDKEKDVFSPGQENSDRSESSTTHPWARCPCDRRDGVCAEQASRFHLPRGIHQGHWRRFAIQDGSLWNFWRGCARVCSPTCLRPDHHGAISRNQPKDQGHDLPFLADRGSPL